MGAGERVGEVDLERLLEGWEVVVEDARVVVGVGVVDEHVEVVELRCEFVDGDVWCVREVEVG